MAVDLVSASSEALNLGTPPVTGAPFSMACWFNVNNITAAHTLIAVGDSGTDSGGRLELAARGDLAGDAVLASGTGGNNGSIKTTTSFSANTWHHAAHVSTSTTNRSAYLDGGGKNTDATEVTPTNIDRLRIGVSADNTPFGYTDGRIAEVGIWNVALTDDEITILALGYSPLLVRPASLVFYAPLIRDISAGAWRDFIGGVNLTEVGTPTVGVHVPNIFNPAPQMIISPPSAGAVEVSLTGSQPFSIGILSHVWNIALAGAEPAPGGVLTAQQTLLRSLTGNKPASSGALTQKYNIALTGSEPASVGALTRVWNVPLAGNQPASSGALIALQTLLRAVTGNQPASSGALVPLPLITLTGAQPASSGVLASLQTLFRSLTGSQPASTGALTFLLGRALTGSQPASVGALVVFQALLRNLTGSQPVSSGVLTQRYNIALAGNQLASSGSLTSLQVLVVTLAGSQPAGSGSLAALQTLLRTLTGNQPTSTGILAQQYGISLIGSQSASSGSLVALIIVTQAALTFAITLDGVVAAVLTLDGVVAGALTLDGKVAQSITIDSNP